MNTGMLAATAAFLALAAAAQDATSPEAAPATDAPANESGLSLHDAYLRSANPMTAAAFMEIDNAGDVDCTLTAVKGDAAARIELHTHREVDGVMQMLKVEEGLTVPAGGSLTLARGGAHVMFMGLAQPLAQGDRVALTLDFGPCGTLPVEVSVDNMHNIGASHGATSHDSAPAKGGVAHGGASSH